MFSKILIANRGEIARRIIRTARRMGIQTVAVFSEADANLAFVKEASESYLLGPAPACDSYLCGAKIIEIAKKSGAQAIHPGYGFLSENRDFARLCQQNGIKFIGPSIEAITAMALKSEAKILMREAGVPVTPGYEGENQETNHLVQKAREIGYPVLIKAIAGGGGKGMRRVDTEAEFEDALLSCQREGQNAFSDARVLLEKYVTKPRHIEVQVFGDRFGHVVHLFERDCSVQRRHQKVIEEAPAPDLPQNLRAQMTEAAVKAAKAIDYEGAGTIEFLVDVSNTIEDAPFYFMEMNTRLQVEHPVTEEITGIDLVEWQLRIASGEKLPLRQDEIIMKGHAFEVRLYAEDPQNDFLPEIGQLTRLQFPSNARIESAVCENDHVTPYYDPMLAKLIVRGFDRKDALLKLSRALVDTHVAGLKSNIGFLRRLSAHESLAKADVDTGFIARHLESLIAPWTDELCRPSHDKTSPFNNKDGWWPNLGVRAPNWAGLASSSESAEISGDILAPMPGKIIDIFVCEGQTVAKGDKLLTLSAMKIEHTLKAPKAGTITKLLAQKDQQLHDRGLLVVISEQE